MKKGILSLISVITMASVMLTATGCGLIGNDTTSTNTDDVEPTIKLGSYVGMNVETKVATVSDEDVDKSIIDSINAKSELVEVTDRTAVIDGDTVNIDFVGKIDGKEFSGGSAEGQDLIIGSGRFIDDFEEQLIGSNVGDTVEVNVTFPKDYKATDMAGKDAVFTVVINSIKVYPAVELSDEVINEFTEGKYTSLEEYRAYTRSNLESTAETTNTSNRESAIIEALMSVCSVENPTGSRVQQYIDNDYQMYQYYADMYSMAFSDFIQTYVGTDESGLAVNIRASAEQKVSYLLVMEKIASEQGIEIDESEYNAMLESNATANSTDVSTYEKSYGSFMKDGLVYKAVMEYLVSVSNITEIPA